MKLFSHSIMAVVWFFAGFVPVASAFNMAISLEPQAIRMGEAAQLVISLEGVDRGPAPEIPNVPGLRIGTPQVEQNLSMTMVNGRMEQRRVVNYRYNVIPLQPGEYQIGPITYSHGNETFTVAPRALRVVMPSGEAGTGGATQLSDLVFAEITVDKDRVFVQEPLTLTIAIYARGVNLGRDVQLINMPDTGIQTQPFQELRTTREVVRNDVYDVRRYQTQIRPLTAGALRFAPELRVQLLVPRQSQQNHPFFNDAFFQGFFSNMEAHPFDLKLEPVNVTVRSLPEAGRPESFTGGVGQFQFHVRVQEAEIQPGDPITLTFMIEGEGNMDAVGAPALADSDLFRVYPPRVSHTDIDRAGFRGRRVFEQVIIPRAAESSEIPPLAFSYFDTTERQYRTITRGPFALNLKEGDTTAQRVVRADGASPDHQARIIGQDIRYIKPAPEQWTSVHDTPWYTSRAFLIAQVAPPVLVLAVFLLARHRRALDADVAKARRYRAPRSARTGMRRAEQALTRHDEDDFYNGIWTALTAYFGNRLNLASGEVTTDVVLDAMQRQGFAEASRDQLQRVFSACEQRRFGRVASDPSTMRALMDDCKAIFKACERVAS